MLDIDFFKKVNDTFGHDVGDQVIKHVAQVCRSGIRNSDIPGRLGGEEFALLRLETDVEVARIVAERVRTAVAQHPVPCGSESIAVTVSIGIATADASVANASQLLKRADEALYAAKRGGRNRVVLCQAAQQATQRIAEPSATAA